MPCTHCVVFKEELKILIRYINVRVATLFSVLFQRLPTSRESIPELGVRASLLVLDTFCIAYLLILVLFKKIADVRSLADILELGPCKASRNLIWINEGLA